jgi:hypothetical protein
MSQGIVIRETGRLVSLELRKGIDFSFPFRMRAAGVPMNLAGYTFSAQVRKDPLIAGAAILEFGFTIDAPAGLVTMAATASQTAALQAGARLDSPESRYWWDCRMTTSTGAIRPLFHGPLLVLRPVTV